MAACFDFNGTDESISLADAAGYDLNYAGDTMTLSFWINPDSRTAEEVLFDRSGWFKITLDADNVLTIYLGSEVVRRVRYIPNSKKTHVMIALKLPTAVASGTADTNVASLLIDTDANWWTNGVNMTNDKRGKYIVYNRTDRVFGYGYVIADRVITASTDTVVAATDKITITAHGYEDGCPVLVIGDDVPAGTVNDGTLYYVGGVDANTIYLYDTAAHAVTNDGSTGLIDLTDAGSGTVTFRAREDAILLASDLCPDGNEVVSVFTEPWAATLRVWVNGVRQDIDETLDTFNVPADSAEAINVATLKGGAQYYDGKMNEVVIWTPGFATDQVAENLYNNGTELEAFEAYDFDMTLYGHWSFDENAASTAVDNDEGTAGRDGTASGNTSTLYVASMDPTTYWAGPGILAFTAAASVTGSFVIDHMEWDGSATADDDLEVNDSNGNEIWTVNNKIANDRAVKYLDDIFDGITVATIDAGTLYVYLR